MIFSALSPDSSHALQKVYYQTKIQEKDKVFLPGSQDITHAAYLSIGTFCLKILVVCLLMFIRRVSLSTSCFFFF